MKTPPYFEKHSHELLYSGYITIHSFGHYNKQQYQHSNEIG